MRDEERDETKAHDQPGFFELFALRTEPTSCVPGAVPLPPRRKSWGPSPVPRSRWPRRRGLPGSPTQWFLRLFGPREAWRGQAPGTRVPTPFCWTEHLG